MIDGVIITEDGRVIRVLVIQLAVEQDELPRSPAPARAPNIPPRIPPRNPASSMECQRRVFSKVHY